MNLSDSYSLVLDYLALAILVFIAGSFIGAFCSKMVYRLEGNRVNRLLSPSFCPACGKKLKTLDKLPVIGYFRVRGRCRRCGAPVTKRYLLFELLGAILPFVIGYFNNFDLSSLTSYYFYMLLLTAGAIAYDKFRLPGKVSFFILVVAIFNAILQVNTLIAVGGSFLSGFVVIFILYTYLRRDERLTSAFFFAASGAFLGSLLCTAAVLVFFILISLIMKLFSIAERKRYPPYNLLLVILVFIGSCFKPYIIEKVVNLITFVVS